MSSSFWLASGCSVSQAFALDMVLLPPPSIMYPISVHGAPVKPNRGTFPSSIRRIIVIASPTYFSRSIDPVWFNRSRSAGPTSGSGNTGPTPGFISTTIPSACGMTRMSEKMIEASRSNRRRGCIVTSQASSGVRQTVKKSCFARTS
uniref:Putative secreted peptide n=1 Tax=Anopheles braziliensis TaxID=58242 RepID=A0A2M3ZRL6_9DIPT